MKLGALVVLAACGRVGFDARPDALGTGDATGDAALPFCQTVTATFCDDFDEGQALSRWTSINMFGGTVGVDAADAQSAPDAMAVSLATVAASATADADAETPLLGIASELSATFDLAFEQIGSGDPVVFAMDLDDGSQTHEIELVQRVPPGVAYIEDIVIPNGGSAQFTYDDLVTVDAGAWHHVAIDLVSGAGSQLTVAIDGAQVLQVVPSASNGGQAYARAGTIYLAGPATPWLLHLDNIAVTAR